MSGLTQLPIIPGGIIGRDELQTNSDPDLIPSIIELAPRAFRLPMYLTTIFSPMDRDLAGSSTADALDIPLTPLYGGSSESMQKYTFLVLSISLAFFVPLPVKKYSLPSS